jgi:hypothetical protein
MNLDRPGWVLGVPNRTGFDQQQRVAVYHHAGHVGIWVYGDCEEDWVPRAQYEVDLFYVKRRIQLDELIRMDDVEGPNVRVL